MAKFYTYRQNDSGGYFEQDIDVDVIVVIEADSAEHANEIASDIGIYFDGCVTGMDCDCCGDRWSETWEEDGKDSPQYYGTPIEEERDWIVYYLDGRVERDEKFNVDWI